MADFKYLNYHTEYSATGDHKKRMGREACFGEIFHDRNIRNVDYEVKVYKGDVILKEQKDNSCFLTKKELYNHLKIVKHLFDFKYNIEDCGDYFSVKLKVENKKNIYHRYLLTWLRYSYEYPYNVLLRDAIMMKKSDKKYKFESIFNLFLTVSHCYDGAGFRDIHSITQEGIFLTQDKLKKRIGECDTINSIVRHSNLKNVKMIKSKSTTEYWDNEFETRLPIYNKAYNLKKDEK